MPRTLHPDRPDEPRAALSRATEVSLRRAALRLVARHGYDATTVDDIAREAGVSPDTFSLYFPDKETAVLFPDGLVAGLVLTALGQRPPDEDPVVALVAAVAGTFESIAMLTGDDPLLRTGLRLMLSEPQLQRALVDRRISVETAAWAALQRRGVGPDDLGVRAATATIVALGFLALQRWATDDGSEPLPVTLADCLRHAPDRSLLERGLDPADRPLP
jgi:AcrR family transcriptional regulator